jgi:hypothetical protein
LAIHSRDFYDLPDDQLLDRMGGALPSSEMAHAIRMEFERRALMAQREAALSQKRAADAAEAANMAAADGARQAQKTSYWTKVSAIAIAASVVVMMIGTVVDALKPAG